MFLFIVIFNFFLAINTSSDTKSFVTLNEDINLRSLEEEKEPKKGSQKFQCAPTMEEANPAEGIYFCNDANKYTCNATIEGEPYPRCECMKDYANDKGNTTACSYERKKQLTAFLLELFVGFGAGHFYRANYLEASLKLVAFLFGIYIICLFPLTAKCVADCCDCDCLVVLISLFWFLISAGLAFWFIFDLVWFGKNKYPDKYGYCFSEWGKEKLNTKCFDEVK